ncbi:hypothetical protein FPQ18DRAFT_396526 [Pyronema domesticum]|nr:hypothetical protein FPQ18DRAFT_396526 [Pyronema domesticum]
MYHSQIIKSRVFPHFVYHRHTISLHHFLQIQQCPKETTTGSRPTTICNSTSSKNANVSIVPKPARKHLILLPLGPLRKRVYSELPSKTGLEDPDLEHDLSNQKDEEHGISHQSYGEHDLSNQIDEKYDHSEQYYDDSEYGDSYQYYDEQEEEEEDGMPDFECEEGMHRWLLKKAENSHRTALFKDVGNQYPVWLKCEDKDLDGGLMKAMMMASNLCDIHDEGPVEDL